MLPSLRPTSLISLFPALPGGPCITYQIIIFTTMSLSSYWFEWSCGISSIPLFLCYQLTMLRLDLPTNLCSLLFPPLLSGLPLSLFDFISNSDTPNLANLDNLINLLFCFCVCLFFVNFILILITLNLIFNFKRCIIISTLAISSIPLNYLAYYFLAIISLALDGLRNLINYW